MSARQLTLMITLIVAHVILAFLMPASTLLGVDFNEMIVIGAGIAQVNLIALWGAMSVGPVVRRLPWAALLATTMWFAIMLGNRWAFEDDRSFFRMSRSGGILIALIIGGGVAAAMAPLWVARRWQSWRLLRPQKPGVDSDQFNIREVLVGISLLCVAMGLGRAALPPGEGFTDIDTHLQVLLLLATVANLVTALPMVWIAFLRPWKVALALIVGVPAYSIVVGIVEAFFLRLSDPSGAPPDLVFDLWTVNVTQFWVLAGSLIVLRRAGFRLVRLTTLHGKDWQPHKPKIEDANVGENDDAASDIITNAAAPDA